MRLISESFTHGGEIPGKFTCDGRNISPALSWTGAPRHTEVFALVVNDIDAPKPGGFTHWVLYNIPSDVHQLDEDVAASESSPSFGTQGRNDSGTTGYVGPCPPAGRHHYFFHLYALRRKLYLDAGATRDQVLSAVEGQILDYAELIGTYEKAPSGQR